ncbi:MAG: hydroxymethylbilane synthase [Candidatus Omnitrophica bacterium]|nr:hydroxymethylbilane synthase [Candidatus Omnitrophota bacterium]
MRKRKFRAGTRTSPLALKQAEEIITSLRAISEFEIVGIDTYGDRDKVTPISDMEGTDFFTREIDLALLKGEIDFAVHSAKDLPNIIPEGLCVAAITRPIDPFDALVSKGNLKIDELKKNAKIGASSQRRKDQLKKYREDFKIVDIRGNIGERLSLLDGGKTFAQLSLRGTKCRSNLKRKIASSAFGLLAMTEREQPNLDAIVVAACALVRLGLQHRIAQRIPFEILTPHPLQGALAVEARQGDKEIIDLVKSSLRGSQ